MVVSIALFGAFIGSLIAGPLSNKFGRKPIIITTCMMYVFGTLVIALATQINHLLIGRVIVGFSIGVSSMVVPVYLSEVAPVKIRGRLIANYIAAMCIS